MSITTDFMDGAFAITSSNPTMRLKGVAMVLGVGFCVMTAAFIVALQQKSTADLMVDSKDAQLARGNQQLIDADRATAEQRSKAVIAQREKEEALAMLDSKADTLAQATANVDRLLQERSFNQTRINQLDDASKALSVKLEDALSAVNVASKTIDTQAATIIDLKKQIEQGKERLSAAITMQKDLAAQLDLLNVKYAKLASEKRAIQDKVWAYENILGFRPEGVVIIKAKKSAVGENWTGTPLDGVGNAVVAILQSGGTNIGKEANFARFKKGDKTYDLEISDEQLAQLLVYKERMAANERERQTLEEERQAGIWINRNDGVAVK
ncbi:MAG: hypothetical protein HC888_04615 [Candidatus Competibacteraceae bacterium]|nr:hypothetical protein [Candidatus Competibacteraceae bacterium]